MGRRGPPRKPTSIKKLEGNPGRRPLNEDEPKFEGQAEMPHAVRSDPVARAEWLRRAPELIRNGLLTAQDQTEFAAYCLNHSLAVKYWNLCKKDRGGELSIAKGYLNAYLKADAARTKLAAKFGFDPSDRSQIKVTPQKTDPVADFAKRKGQLVLMQGKKQREKAEET